jgi:hypothetical protein
MPPRSSSLWGEAIRRQSNRAGYHQDIDPPPEACQHHCLDYKVVAIEIRALEHLMHPGKPASGQRQLTTLPRLDCRNNRLTIIIDALLTTACIFVIANRLTD